MKTIENSGRQGAYVKNYKRVYESICEHACGSCWRLRMLSGAYSNRVGLAFREVGKVYTEHKCVCR